LKFHNEMLFKTTRQLESKIASSKPIGVGLEAIDMQCWAIGFGGMEKLQVRREGAVDMLFSVT